jgi:tryptophan-rich sensory protein
MRMNRKGAVRLVAAILVCEIVGVLGSIFTTQSIPTWYAGLVKPSFTPPNWVFGPVWTLLYLLMGVSLYLVWSSRPKKARTVALQTFGPQLVLNLLWSVLFFGLRSPLLGMIGIVLLWVVLLVTILRFYNASKSAAWVMVPYLLWVTFAALLNFYIFILN